MAFEDLTKLTKVLSFLCLEPKYCTYRTLLLYLWPGVLYLKLSTLPYLTLPYPTLPCPALPYPQPHATNSQCDRNQSGQPERRSTSNSFGIKVQMTEARKQTGLNEGQWKGRRGLGVARSGSFNINTDIGTKYNKALQKDKESLLWQQRSNYF